MWWSCWCLQREVARLDTQTANCLREKASVQNVSHPTLETSGWRNGSPMMDQEKQIFHSWSSNHNILESPPMITLSHCPTQSQGNSQHAFIDSTYTGDVNRVWHSQELEMKSKAISKSQVRPSALMLRNKICRRETTRVQVGGKDVQKAL